MESENAFLFGRTNILSTYFWRRNHNGSNHPQESEAMDGSNISVYGSGVSISETICGVWRTGTDPTVRHWEKGVNRLSSMVVDVWICSSLVSKCSVLP